MTCGGCSGAVTRVLKRAQEAGALICFRAGLCNKQIYARHTHELCFIRSNGNKISNTLVIYNLQAKSANST
jgi:hypothetical protein